MRAKLVVSALVVMASLVGAGGYLLAHRLGEHTSGLLRPSCAVTAGGVVLLDADQVANAATIAAVGARRGLPERAVLVALATAYQESKIRNLSGGDRDSVGLFQQRPSQGWGSARQISDPVPSLRTLCPAVPPAIEGAVLRALTKRPDDRFPSAAEFASALSV